MLRPKTRPGVERLETLSLLSAGLSLSMTTDKPSYVAGQVVTMTLNETNTTRTNLAVTDKPSGVQFSVQNAGGATVWTDAGVMKPFFSAVQTLKPGQSISYSESWTSTQTGSLHAVGLDRTLNASASTAFTVTPPAPVPAKAGDLAWTAVTIDNLSLTGQGVQFSVTEKNTTNHAVLINPADEFTVLSASKATVWQSAGISTVRLNNMPTSPNTMALAPGESFTFTALWNGKEPNGTAAPAGTYTVSFGSSDPGAPTGPVTFQIPGTTSNRGTGGLSSHA